MPLTALDYVKQGYSHHLAGRLDDAYNCYSIALHMEPHNGQALHLAGLVDYQYKKYNEALAKIGACVKSTAVPQGAHASYGLVLMAHGRLKEAIKALRMAIQLDPSHADAWINLGNALQESNQLDEAENAYQRAIQLVPDMAEAHFNLGNCNIKQKKWRQAKDAYSRAINLTPHHVRAHVNMGRLLLDQGHYEEALQHFEHAAALDPNQFDIHLYISFTYSKLNRFMKSALASERALALDPASMANPDEALARQGLNLFHILTEQGKIDEVIALFEKLEPCVSRKKELWDYLLFCLNYHQDKSNADIISYYRRWESLHTHLHKPTSTPALAWDKKRRLRIGYVSADFKKHSARHVIEPLLIHHDRSRFELFCYSNVATPDDYTRYFQNMAEHWRDISSLDDDKATKVILKDKIDILVDLMGHTDGNRLLVFARKPAPIQVTFLGYCYTTGLSTVDWFLADDYLAPADQDLHFTEGIWRLPRHFGIHQPPHDMPEVNEELPATRNGFITFGCFSRTIRINSKVIAAWSRILNAIPDSRLMLNNRLFQDPDARQHFIDLFNQHGISASRLELVFTSPQYKTWEAYHNIDIALDPFPHNAGATTVEALWMGVPVLTIKDRPPLGRIGHLVLNAMGLDDWVADSVDEYVAIAVRKAHDQAGLRSLRPILRDRFKNSPLFDYVGYVRAIEAAYIAFAVKSIEK